MKLYHYILIILLFSLSLYSQESEPSIINSTDSIKVNTNSVLDTIVTFSAKDSLVYSIKSKTLRLKQDAKLNFKVQSISSDLIILNLGNSTLEALPDTTKSGKERSYPKFSDGGQSFVGAKIFYNFDTKQGSVNMGETEITEGFYYGSKIKRVSDDELFVQDGCYTDCNHPHPHYYFGSPKMKMQVNDKVFIDPAIVYVEDLPIFALPIGLFFDIKKGTRQGLILPSVFNSYNRGMMLENLGYYFPISDYFDTRLSLNLYTKGGFLVGNTTNWKLKNVLDGSIESRFGYTRYSPDDDYAQNWSLRLNHSHRITPQIQLNANLQFMTEDFNRRTSNNIYDRSRQEISSYASYSESFDNGISYSINYSRSQNIIDNTYSQSLPSLNLNIPTLYPLRNLVKPTSSLSWLRDLTFSYSTNANFDQNKRMNITSQSDTTYSLETSNRIVHSPSISISPKLGYFTLNPYIRFSANNYFRRSERRFNESDSTIEEYNSKNGLFTEYNYSIGANLSTTLWGILKTNIGRLSFIRHKFRPSIGYSYTPDLSDKMYGEYYNPVSKRQVQYSYFEKDGGGIASRLLQSNMNVNLDNTFSISLKQDTGKAKKIDLLRMSLNTSYNFAKDSLKLNDINANFSTPPIGNFNINGNMSFSMYERIQQGDRVVILDKFLINQGKGLAYLNNLTLNLSTSFSNEGFFPKYESLSSLDSMTLGDRFSNRVNYDEAMHDYFGDNSSGFDRFSPPWQMNLSLYFSYYRAGIDHFNKSLNLSTDITFRLTPTWNVSARTGIDFINGDLSNTSIIITKQLHCWNFYFEWYPVGVNRGFYFRLSPNSNMLKDLKIESPRRQALDYN